MTHDWIVKCWSNALLWTVSERLIISLDYCLYWSLCVLPKHSQNQQNFKIIYWLVGFVGHVCDEAEDGLEAVAKIKHIMSEGNQHGQRAYDAVLMDFIMPNMNGPTATEEIRSLGYTAPIFGVTGNGLTTDIEYFKNSGVDSVLLKPLSIVSFYDAMTQFGGAKIS